MDPRLSSARKQIDLADAEIITALANRMAAVRSVWKIKKEAGLPALDEKRWSEVMRHIEEHAKTKGLDLEFVRKIFAKIHEHALEIETDKP